MQMTIARVQVWLAWRRTWFAERRAVVRTRRSLRRHLWDAFKFQLLTFGPTLLIAAVWGEVQLIRP